jgi:hypothetical protein
MYRAQGGSRTTTAEPPLRFMRGRVVMGIIEARILIK